MVKRARRKELPPPELFLDRGLGRHVVAGALREAGLVVHVMEAVFGDDPKWRKDEVWIPEVAGRGWIILMKDDQVRMKPRERQALMSCGAKVFCITNANISGPDMAERFVKHQAKIVRLARKPGPYVYGVYDDDVVRLFPPDPSRASGGTKQGSSGDES